MSSQIYNKLWHIHTALQADNTNASLGGATVAVTDWPHDA